MASDTRPLNGPVAGDNHPDQRTHVLRVYLLLAFLSLSIFGGLQIFAEHNPLVGYLELAAAAAVVFTALILHVTSNVVLARVCFLLTLITMMIVMLMTGGTQGTGIFWLFMFPVAAFFLAGKREGTVWIAGLFGAIFLVWIMTQTTTVSFYYSDIVVRQLAVTLFVVTIGLYVYQQSREVLAERDRSSRQELEAYLKQMTALHAKVDRAKSEFVTLASHQLRTPISAISWISELLLSGDAGKLKSEQLEHIRQIAQSNERMAELVDAMLTVSSLELGNLPIQLQPVDVAKTSHKVLQSQLAIQPTEKLLHIEELYDPSLAVISFDPNIMRLILSNLISNAIKYTPAEGRVTITIKPGHEKLGRGSGGTIFIEVTDTGYGIPEKQQAKLFTKMFRADNIKDKDTNGTGLGLYIVKAITEYVGGHMQFVSVENKGSTFSVLLPVKVVSKNPLRDQPSLTAGRLSVDSKRKRGPA